MKTRLYLARHGETLWNKKRRLQGHLNSQLTPLGKLQSAHIAEKLSGIGINTIISSPLERAVETAFICQQAFNIPHKTYNSLLERNLGDWQGKDVSYLQTLPEYNELLNQVTSLTINNAESALDCGKRIFSALQQLANTHLGQNSLIIFHGEAMRCLFFLLGQTQTTNAFNLFANGCIVALDYQQTPPYFTIKEN